MMFVSLQSHPESNSFQWNPLCSLHYKSTWRRRYNERRKQKKEKTGHEIKRMTGKLAEVIIHDIALCLLFFSVFYLSLKQTVMQLQSVFTMLSVSKSVTDSWSMGIFKFSFWTLFCFPSFCSSSPPFSCFFTLDRTSSSPPPVSDGNFVTFSRPSFSLFLKEILRVISCLYLPPRTTLYQFNFLLHKRLPPFMKKREKQTVKKRKSGGDLNWN